MSVLDNHSGPRPNPHAPHNGQTRTSQLTPLTERTAQQPEPAIERTGHRNDREFTAWQRRRALKKARRADHEQELYDQAATVGPFRFAIVLLAAVAWLLPLRPGARTALLAAKSKGLTPALLAELNHRIENVYARQAARARRNCTLLVVARVLLRLQKRLDTHDDTIIRDGTGTPMQAAASRLAQQKRLDILQAMRDNDDPRGHEPHGLLARAAHLVPWLELTLYLMFWGKAMNVDWRTPGDSPQDTLTALGLALGTLALTLLACTYLGRRLAEIRHFDGTFRLRHPGTGRRDQILHVKLATTGIAMAVSNILVGWRIAVETSHQTGPGSGDLSAPSGSPFGSAPIRVDPLAADLNGLGLSLGFLFALAFAALNLLLIAIVAQHHPIHRQLRRGARSLKAHDKKAGRIAKQRHGWDVTRGRLQRRNDQRAAALTTRAARILRSSDAGLARAWAARHTHARPDELALQRLVDNDLQLPGIAPGGHTDLGGVRGAFSARDGVAADDARTILLEEQ
jgi:hypothetical protein